MAHMRRNHFRFTMPFQCDLCKYRSSMALQFRNHFDRVFLWLFWLKYFEVLNFVLNFSLTRKHTAHVVTWYSLPLYIYNL